MVILLGLIRFEQVPVVGAEGRAIGPPESVPKKKDKRFEDEMSDI